MYFAFASMPSQLASREVITLLAIPRQVLFAEADQVLRRNLSWLGWFAGLTLIIGWVGSKFLILHPVKGLVRFAARLASGDLSVRTGLPHSRDELGQLTLAFDQMAQALEERDRERLRASQKLQVLSHRLVEVQEAERRHIARELHDEIGQSLTAAELNLQAALQAPASSKLEHRLEESIRAVERVLEQVHDLSLSLRPSMLDDLGLEPALRWYANRQAGLTGMQVRFHADPLENRLDPVIETECFRVAQEALTNVVRHAKATAVSVELTRQDGQLHLSVRDDGVGFDVSGQRTQAVSGASLGLLSMEERASLAGGGLELTSVPGQGTEVHAWFPIRWQSNVAVSQFSE
jgi:signal transduction histidine kinase